MSKTFSCSSAGDVPVRRSFRPTWKRMSVTSDGFTFGIASTASLVVYLSNLIAEASGFSSFMLSFLPFESVITRTFGLLLANGFSEGVDDDDGLGFCLEIFGLVGFVCNAVDCGADICGAGV